MAAALSSYVSKYDIQAAVKAAPVAPRVLQLAVLAAYGPPQSQFARVQQDQILIARAAAEGNVVALATQAALLIAYGAGVPDPARSDSWTYVLDGHRFWVLPLGPEGDWQFDTITKQWSQLETQGFDGLNFTHGIMWNLRVFGGDILYPYLYELDPTQPDDEGWRPVEHVVTGAISTRSPNMVGMANFRCTASVGALSDASTDVNLTFSDDNGHTWVGPFTIAVTEGSYDTQLLWSALGSFSAPGRILKISDSGGMLSIYGADAGLNNFDEDDAGGGGGG